MELTPDEKTELLAYLNGGQYSGAARRKLMEFSDRKGWTTEERQAAIRSLSEPEDSDLGSA